jgi:hypothetical protein
MKNAVFWDVRSVLRLLFIVKVVSSSPILVVLVMEAIFSSETSVLARSTGRHIPEDGILSIPYVYVRDYFGSP